MSDTTASVDINATETTETTASSFLESLPEDLRSEPSLATIKDLGSLAKSYVNAQKMIGNSIRIPTNEAAPEIKQEFMKKILSVDGVVPLPVSDNPELVKAYREKVGIPENAEDYRLAIDEEFQPMVNKDAISGFKKFSQDINLTPDQAQQVMNLYLQDKKAEIQSLVEDREQSKEFLKKTWGSEYDNRLELAKSVATHLGTKYPDAIQSLVTGPAGNNPAVLIMLSELGKIYREQGIISGRSTAKFGLTPEEARAKIDDVKNNPGHPYFNDRDPGHQAAVENMKRYYEAAFPETGESV